MPTPHIGAEKNEISDIVLMPGDPLRAKFIAERYLTEVTIFNDIRNMLGYTGFFNGKRISVMGSGMGMPSIGIYSYELYNYYDVNQIIRVGSCGTMMSDINLFDIILVDNACSDTNYDELSIGINKEFVESSLPLTDKIEATAKQENTHIHRGNVYSTDVFYGDSLGSKTALKYHCLAAEMETFALFLNAKKFNKEAACVLTVSDSLITEEVITSEQRETSFITMIELVLKSI